MKARPSYRTKGAFDTRFVSETYREYLRIQVVARRAFTTDLFDVIIGVGVAFVLTSLFLLSLNFIFALHEQHHHSRSLVWYEKRHHARAGDLKKIKATIKTRVLRYIEIT